MDTHDLPISKVLVLDTDESSLERIRRFCDDNRLQGLRVGRNNILSVLKTNLDLGGLLISQRLGTDPRAGLQMAQRIAQMRPELPIMLRADAPLPDGAELPQGIAAVYSLDDIESLQPVLERNIFSVAYPPALVRGIIDIMSAAIGSQFPALALKVEPPCVVRDQLIYGELFTLIPIESNWCRGYMTLQTEQDALQQLIRAGRSVLPTDSAEDFRTLNFVLGELTNMVWGAFKNRYQTNDAADQYLSQVPIVVNHAHRYISFGTLNPQLCFRCVLTDPEDDSLPPIVIQQRFVFNLAWSPERFIENAQAVDSLVEAGEIEFF